MGRKGSRYTLDEKLFYIGLVQKGQSANSIHRQYGVHDSQIQQWLERYEPIESTLKNSNLRSFRSILEVVPHIPS